MYNGCLKVLIYYILHLDTIYKIFPKKMLMHVVKGINCESEEKGKQLSDVLCWDI